jgi:capsular exopolysaccharide synthesis family protein
MEFTIKEMIEIVMKRMVLIILCTLVGVGSSFIANSYIIRPSYTASVQMYVNPDDDTSSSNNINELYYVQKVVNTYINFLQTKSFYRQVLNESGYSYTEKELKKMTGIHSVNDTEIFEISVTAYDPVVAFRIVETMQRIVPDVIKEIKTSARISVVDPVVVPTLPSGPNVLLNTALGGMVGLMISIITAFLIELLDVKVKDQEELADKYHYPILGAIPVHQVQENKRFTPRRLLFFLKKNKNKKPAGVLRRDEMKFYVTEAYTALRTNLRFILRKEGCKKILVNSPIPEEGKSTTCTNIGITIAQTGAKVLLLDCDLRKGTLHQYFKAKSAPGISDILSGMMEEKEVIQETPFANLFMITMGAIPPNPAELLSSTQMEELIRRLEKNYDYIIIDSPPVNIVSDALSLSKMVDGILIVVKECFTTHPNIVNALSKYKFADAKLLGFVINGTSLSQGNKSKAGYYYYHTKNDD